MIRNRLSRLGIVLTSAALASMLLGTGVVSAANPTWRVDFDNLPNVVSPEADAGWLVTVTNDGPSNINDLNITIDSKSTTAGYSYLSTLDVSTGFVVAPCPTVGGVTTCNVGTLPDDGTVTFTVAFAVPPHIHIRPGELVDVILNPILATREGETGIRESAAARADERAR